MGRHGPRRGLTSWSGWSRERMPIQRSLSSTSARPLPGTGPELWPGVPTVVKFVLLPVQASQEQDLWASALPAIGLGMVTPILGILCIHRAYGEAKTRREENQTLGLKSSLSFVLFF